MNPSLVTCIAISPDGTDVFVGQVSDDRYPAVSRWSLPTLSLLPGPDPCPLAPHPDTCSVLARSEHGLLAAAGMGRQQLVVTDIAGGSRTTPIAGEVEWAVLAGSLLASSGARTQITDLDSGRTVWLQKPPPTEESRCTSSTPLIVFRPDLQAFAVGGHGEPNVLVYPLPEVDRQDPTGPSATLPNAPERLRWLGFGPRGQYLVAVDEFANSTSIWRPGEAEPHLPDLFWENAPGCWSFAFHPDGEHCAMGMLSGYTVLYRLSDGELLDARQEHAGRVQALAFTPDGTLLLSGGDDGRLLAWQTD